jgi:hypothetical protein
MSFEERLFNLRKFLMRTYRQADKIELGCGSHKRSGFFGIDKTKTPEVDLVMDIERQPLPFRDGSVDYIYSSHMFEHLDREVSPILILREIVRVARHGATVEIWTPNGRSDDGLLFGHHEFYTETHWRHICYQYDDFYFGKGTLGRVRSLKTQYVLAPAILDQLKALGITVEFAMAHMSNIFMEFGVFLEVDKTTTNATRPQVPVRELCYRRDEVLMVFH